MKLTIQYNVEQERVGDLLCCALEGGSDYWYTFQEASIPKMALSDVVLKGGYLMIGEQANKKVSKKLNYKAACDALAIMAQKYPADFSDFLNENEDANTGDTLLQCFMFGELVYG